MFGTEFEKEGSHGKKTPSLSWDLQFIVGKVELNAIEATNSMQIIFEQLFFLKIPKIESTSILAK